MNITSVKLAETKFCIGLLYFALCFAAGFFYGGLDMKWYFSFPILAAIYTVITIIHKKIQNKLTDMLIKQNLIEDQELVEKAKASFNSHIEDPADIAKHRIGE